MNWVVRKILRADVTLHLEMAGSGAPLLVLSGGPGDSCSYMKAAVQSLLETRTVVLLDQRGTGQSILESISPETLQLPLLLEDLVAVQFELGVAQLEVLGHSWGANLGLLYASFYPDNVAKLLAVSPGPIRSDFNAVAGANFSRGFSATDFAELAELQLQRKQALAALDVMVLQQLHQKSATQFWARNAVYNNEARAAFIQSFDASEFHPLVHRYIWNSINWDDLEAKLADISAQVKIIYGYQDFEPITQAYRIKELVTQAQLEFINHCGHIPWLEQPSVFSKICQDFFTA